MSISTILEDELKYEEIKKMLLSGKKIKLIQSLKKTSPTVKNRLLRDSIIKNDLDVLRFLINHSLQDGNVNIGNHINNVCPIHIAAQYNNVDAINLLIEKGADINDTNNVFLISPMHVAINRGSFDAVKELIKHSADINILADVSQTIEKDSYIKTQFKNKKMCESCKKMCECTKVMRTPLQYAIFVNNHRITRLLLTNGAILSNSTDIKKNELFFALFSANQGPINTEIVKDLIKIGSELNIVSECGMATPLYQAVFNNNLEIVNLLIEHGANVNLSKRYNECPLSNAAQFGYLPIVMTLIQHGANVNNINSTQLTSPLYLAAQNNHLEVVIELVKAGANIDHLNREYRRPIIVAMHKRNHLIVNYLLASGSNLGFCDIAPHVKKLKELTMCSYKYCTNKRESTCSACGIQGYCSRECQKLDWPIHKNICKLLIE